MGGVATAKGGHMPADRQTGPKEGKRSRGKRTQKSCFGKTGIWSSKDLET